MLLLLSNNINIWMLSLKIFGSVCADAADYLQIRFRPSIPAGASKELINEYNNTSQFFTSSRKISCSEKCFHIFHFLYIFKTNGTELIDESADVCLHFSGMWRHRPLKEYSVFVLEFALHVLSLVHILCEWRLLAGKVGLSYSCLGL